MSKVISYRQAADLVPDGANVATVSFGLGGLAEQLLVGVKERYAQSQHPKDITFMTSCGIGNGKPGRGADHLMADGLVKRLIMAHVGFSPLTVDRILSNKVECYFWPQGVFTGWYRAIASNKPYLTKVGLDTFVDPRIEGSKGNDITTEDLIDLVDIGGEEYLNFQKMPIDIAFIRATASDHNGNLVVNGEVGKLEQLELAMATKNSGGIVIAQVKEVVANNTFNPKEVLVPGALVDYLVVGKDIYHYQTSATFYDKKLSNEVFVPNSDIERTGLISRKMIGRRAAMELKKGAIVNLGVGMPDQVAQVASEEGVTDDLVFVLDMGLWGGKPAQGLNFGASINAQTSIPMANIFDFYDGFGLDLTVLGIGQIDQYGNNNITKFGGKVAGPGGFINLSQNTKNVVFMGNFTIGGKTYIKDGKLIIEDQGKGPKFVKEVEQISFSGKNATVNQQNILYVTERAVFDLFEGQVRLIEIAPGVDLQEDILNQMEFEPLISEELRLMDPAIFQDEWGGLKKYM